MAKIGELYVAITGDNSSLKSSLTDSGKSVSSFGSAVTKQLAGIATATAAIGLAVKGIQFNAAAESAQQAFSVMLGSASQARDMLKELRDFANNTPLEFADIRQASQTLLQFGVDADSVIPTIKQLGDVSGGDAQKLQSLALAFGQMSSTGRLMGQDLLQMINAGFNPLRIISEQTGKSMADLKKEMEAGAISSQMVAEAFKVATSEGGQFYQMLEKQAGTLNGAFSTLNDSVDTFLGQTTQGMSGPLVQAMQDASRNLSALGDNFSAIGDVMGGIIIIVNGVANAIAFLTEHLNGTALVLGAVAIGFGLAFGPVVGVIAGVVAAIALVVKGISDIVGESERAKKAEEEAFEAQKRRWKEMDDYYSKKYPQAVKGARAVESETLAKLMQEYRDAGKTKIQLLDEEAAATIEKAKKEKATEADLALIRKYYSEERVKIAEESARQAYEAQNAIAMEFDARDAEALEAQNEREKEAYDYQLSLLNEFEQRDIEAASEKDAREQAAYEKSVQRWTELSNVAISGVATIGTETGKMFVNMENGWGGVANAAIKAIANIVRAMASELEALAAKALAEAIALSLNPLTLAAAPGKYAEAAGYAAGVAGIYAGAGAIEALANFGAGTSSVPKTGSYLVGEYGPEMVTLPRGASVKTNAVTEANMSKSYNVTNNFYSPQAISAIEADRLSRKAMREQRMYA